MAYDEFKRTKKQEDLRFYRNLKNSANRLISREKFERKVRIFQNESESINQKWKTLKIETGQGKVTTPQILRENNIFHTKSENIANSLNRQYVRNITSLIENMDEATQDPLIKYKNSIKPPKSTFTFKKINISDLRKTMNCMKGTGSMGYDDLSLKTIKQEQKEVEPILLHLINRCITTTTFPNTLKISTLVEGWHPVNILTSISKIIERVFLYQMTSHMEENELIDQSHHGAVKKKSTQTLISELHDKLVEDDSQEKESILLILDQSKAYDVIPHDILLRKLEAVGYQPQAIKMMRSFLINRKQLVQVEGARSELLTCGPRSVIQGSTLSCILYLVYILDMPQLFHEMRHEPKEHRECKNQDLKTFVDDAYIQAMKTPNKTFEELTIKTMSTVETYMKNNRLSLNKEKTQVMLFTKNTNEKTNFKVMLNNKEIKHKNTVTILGNTLSDNLGWDNHLRSVLIPQLNNRARTLKQIQKYLCPKFKRILANAIFKSKVLFGIETWGGASKGLLSQIQKIQDKITKMSVPRDLVNKSPRQRLRHLEWLPIESEIKMSTFSLTYKILNWNEPKELSALMPKNNKSLRIGSQVKLDAKPKWLGKSKLTRFTFRNRSYEYNTLHSNITTQKTLKKFKKALKEHLKNKC